MITLSTFIDCARIDVRQNGSDPADYFYISIGHALMLRFGLVALLTLTVPSLPLHAESASKGTKKQERSAEKFFNGTDADRNAMLKDVVKIITAQGYRDLAVVPWFVIMAKNSKGREVLLLVDPVSVQVIEFENDGDEAAALEKVLPKLRK